MKNNYKYKENVSQLGYDKYIYIFFNLRRNTIEI